MKYKTPRYNTEEVIRDFLRSLPDEFEIVPDGHVCVKWPLRASRDTLRFLHQVYKNPYPVKFDRPVAYDVKLAEALEAIAAIAPVETKKRKVALWEYKPDSDNGKLYSRELDWTPVLGLADRWRKVGECEVTE